MTRARPLFLLFALSVACKGTPSGVPEAASTAPKAGAPLGEASTSAAPAPSVPAVATAARSKPFSWDFEGDASGGVPAAFALGRTGAGAPGRWVVKSEAGSPSGSNVLAQLDTDETDFRFPIAVATAPRARDVRVSVRCKTVSGRVDQACGLVARYTDENNYLVTRANALENNIRLYTVRDGKRDQLASADVRVTAGDWHAYRFEVRGDHIQVFWDGKRVLEHRDSTFNDTGLSGVWTKADSVTYFDDLSIEAL